MTNFSIRSIAFVTTILSVSTGNCWGERSKYFHIQIVDSETGRGVPLVELETVDGTRYVSDSAGNIAFFESDLMGKQVYFGVRGHGYEFPEDGFKFAGTRLVAKPGTKAVLKIKRINIAQRLYRITGRGIYRDSNLLEISVDKNLKRIGVKQESQLPNALVVGCDSVQSIRANDKLYWFWGDTNRPSYPLGNFHVPGATTPLKFDANSGVPLTYFFDDKGFAKKTCEMPGRGPTWIDGLFKISDADTTNDVKSKTLEVDKSEIIYAKYVKIKPPMKVYEKGLVQFDFGEKVFKKVTVFDLNAPVVPAGHSLQAKSRDLKGDLADYIYFSDPYPVTRVKANADSIQKSQQYESFTCFVDRSTKSNYKLDRDREKKLIYKWRKNTLPLTEDLQNLLIQKGKMTSSEAFYKLIDVDSGKRVNIADGTVYWNKFRKKWIMIGTEKFGKNSFLGEVWFSEADQLLGPWKKAKRVATHEKYSFYNPRHHPDLDQQGGRFIFFEGTYTRMFSATKVKTHRYDYNQIMYKLDLADPRLRF